MTKGIRDYTYLGRVKQMLFRYQKQEYTKSEEGLCSICVKKTDEDLLCFETNLEPHSGLKEHVRREYAHQDCLENLLDNDNFRKFATLVIEGFTELGLKTQAREEK